MADPSEIRALAAEIEAARRAAAGPAPPEPQAEAPKPETGGEPVPPDVAAEIRQLAGRIEDVLETLDGDIARHPRLAVLAALAAGLVLGAVISR
jgi:hypothetical protein